MTQCKKSTEMLYSCFSQSEDRRQITAVKNKLEFAVAATSNERLPQESPVYDKWLMTDGRAGLKRRGKASRDQSKCMCLSVSTKFGHVI